MMHLLQPVLDLLKLRSGGSASLACRPPVARPWRHWVLLLMTEFALAAVLLAGAALLFVFAPWSVEPPATAPEGAGLSTQRLETTLARYQALRGEHARLLIAPRTVDPAR